MSERSDELFRAMKLAVETAPDASVTGLKPNEVCYLCRRTVREIGMERPPPGRSWWVCLECKERRANGEEAENPKKTDA